MKHFNLNRTCILTVAAIMSVTALAGCSKDTEQTPEETTQPMSAETFKIPDSVETDNANSDSASETDMTAPDETEAAETETSVDMTDIPVYTDLIENAKVNIDNAESFKVECNVIGIVPIDGGKSSRLLNHMFDYSVTQTATHLDSKTEDSNDASKNSSYQEYQVFADSVIATYTVSEDGYWCDDVPKIFSRKNMVQTSVDGIGLMEALTNPETFSAAEITRDDNGNYLMNIEWYRMTIEDTDEVSGYNMFGGLIRALDINDSLLGMDPLDMNGSVTYTFDKNFYLINISGDITSLNAPDKCDLHVEMDFKNWNSVRRIAVPRLDTVANAPIADASETTVADTSETTAVSTEAAVSETTSSETKKPEETEKPAESSESSVPPAVTTARQ